VNPSSRFARKATKFLQGLGALLLVAVLASPEALTFAQAERDRLENLSGRVGSSGYFRLSGRLRGLYPGKQKIMTIKVTNPNRFPIVVKEMRVGVKRSSKPGCGPEWIKAHDRFRISLLVPARARAFASLPVTLKRTAPDACKGARWQLKFRGGAVRKR
jgi:hypothetical protein